MEYDAAARPVLAFGLQQGDVLVANPIDTLGKAHRRGMLVRWMQAKRKRPPLSGVGSDDDVRRRPRSAWPALPTRKMRPGHHFGRRRSGSGARRNRLRAVLLSGKADDLG